MISFMSDDVFKKLEDSKTEAATLTSRDLLCPNCHFRIDTVFSDGKQFPKQRQRSVRSAICLGFRRRRLFNGWK